MESSNVIIQRVFGFVQWLTGAVGCCLFWTHGVCWAIRLPLFNPALFFVGVLFIAVSAAMESKEAKK